METNVKRIFVEKKAGFDIEAQNLFLDLKHHLGISGLSKLRVINRYDVEGVSDKEFKQSIYSVFAEPPVDQVYLEELKTDSSQKILAIEYLPGQYDQRADSAAQCIQILTQKEMPKVRVARVIVLQGSISEKDFVKIKNYCINPVESHEAKLEKPKSLDVEITNPEPIKTINGFINMTSASLDVLLKELGLAMSKEDLYFCQKYFKEQENRDPSFTEIKVLDTYWSDHCRHTTFLTEIDEVTFDSGPYSTLFKNTYNNYRTSTNKKICLMDLATRAMKELRKKGLLNDLDISDEINACTIVVDANIVDKNGNVKKEEWLVLFKNETHNHPTEIEPFGGAATCLGGAIRDPLSGRSYVYQAMRVTGSGDPRTKIQDTIPGKLPQLKISTGAAAGYSSYGNQIGLATGQVTEIYDEDFVAKRMEIGAVIGAAPKNNVIRETPIAGDIIILLGGRTGRDGCGGATGSSKEHTEESLASCGAEVQKGNPPTERKIQRLFRKTEVSRMIKKCNDFGAGGVSVAIGELADGLDINLDLIPKKYEGLDGTELAISESQERMAVVVSPKDKDLFINAAREENLEAIPVATVTDNARLQMKWQNTTIVNLSREFLNSNGAPQHTKVAISSPNTDTNFFFNTKNISNDWISNLQKLNICSEKGLIERFDSTIGAGSVLMPFGGKYQLSPTEGMVAKLPVLDSDTTTGTIMTFGYNPNIAKWSPFHGATYAIIEAITKVVALGGDYKKIRLTLQEYFERLGKDPYRWGKPFSALLGAFHTQLTLNIPSIGGKDSMSGTFKDMNVPPTVVAFAVSTVDVNNVVSTEFKKTGTNVVIINLKRDNNDLPDFEQLKTNFEKVHSLINQNKILAASSVKAGGIAEAISKMCFGNMIGFNFSANIENKKLFEPLYGSIIIEIESSESIEKILKGIDYQILGTTTMDPIISVNGQKIDLNTALQKWENSLEDVFPTKTKPEIINESFKTYSYNKPNTIKPKVKIAKPRIFLPVFPGTNCEYDTARAFTQAGGIVETMIIRNLSSHEIEESIKLITKIINNSQIIMLPGGFSGGDEPDGSGKFIATALRNPYVKEAVMNLLKQRDGLILGICNGFQALIKLGLVPYGEIRDIKEDDPTLTFNKIGRHASCLVNTKIVSKLSPWLNNVKLGDIHTIPISHGEGRFVANDSILKNLADNGQIATQYIDLDGIPSGNTNFNPNASVAAIEGITSPDGRVLGKMGHSERIGTNVYKNVPGNKDQHIFDAGVSYFRN